MILLNYLFYSILFFSVLVTPKLSYSSALPSNILISGDNYIDAGLFENLSAAVQSPITADKCIVISSKQTVGNLTIPVNRSLHILNGGRIKVNSGAILTINGPFYAGLNQAFETGSAVYFTGTHGVEVYPQWFGAQGNGSHDDTIALQSAIDSLFTNDEEVTGGIVKLPRGKYIISKTLVIDSKKKTHLDSISIQGVGKTSSKIICRMSNVNMNGIEFRASIHSSLKNLTISGAPNNGIIFKGPIYSQIQLDNVKSSNNGGSGFYFERGHTFQVSNCFAKSNKGNGFHFSGYHTSVISLNNYADSNGGNGYYINDISYSTFTGCASDNNGFSGYYISNATGLSFVNCGAESNMRAGFSVEATNEVSYRTSVLNGVKNISFDTCVNHNNDLSGNGYGNSFYFFQSGKSYLGPIIIKNCAEIKNTSAYSIAGKGIMDLRIEDCSFLKKIVPPFRQGNRELTYSILFKLFFV